MKKLFINAWDKDAGHFNVYPRGSIRHDLTSYHRRDFYKISLCIGGGTLW
ncbi:hypothetical protein [Pedobacter sp.]|nr:hypothetical protein [Pedobacter sp.]HWW40175.1 hypothetical protein [Pedobacter sp.]